MSKSIGRRERKRQQMMEHLANTAWGMFEVQGYDTVTMEAIADAADVAKGTLYKYFPVKNALLRHRLDNDLAADMPQILAMLSDLPSAMEQLRMFLELCADWSILKQQHLEPDLHLRINETSSPYHFKLPNQSGIEQMIISLIRKGQEAGEFRHDLNVLTTAHYLESLFLAALMGWQNGTVEELHSEIRAMLDFSLRGVQA